MTKAHQYATFHLSDTEINGLQEKSLHQHCQKQSQSWTEHAPWFLWALIHSWKLSPGCYSHDPAWRSEIKMLYNQRMLSKSGKGSHSESVRWYNGLYVWPLGEITFSISATCDLQDLHLWAWKPSCVTSDSWRGLCSASRKDSAKQKQ